ncbi:alpha-d-galacturonidase [Arsenicibacter rosenii]|uniref:Beta-hexosaminidase bacterial type N-terminal domain-containing protein n=1 Tax=Arsenicibacter rosenii TaxID=1750698 RepID=A0A1S2VJW5_9BACT|nr:glycoside hydrolase family 20 zincin-like fold domain-containing protein [Arsenicibacter rosenii]OIN58680.1 hypothetical protein BLX24_14045 [Arsenicibacter rosenii]
MRYNRHYSFLIWLIAMLCGVAALAENVRIVLPANPHARIRFGAERLRKALEQTGYTVSTGTEPAKGKTIILGLLSDKPVAQAFPAPAPRPGKEGFVVQPTPQGFVIGGADPSGTLYGCLALADEITARKTWPTNWRKADQPEMVLRGACIGVQKTIYLPGRNVYEYPYTPENFPWFYDKALWIRYLDMLADNRMNSLYLWNGHPFASLVRLNDYPYAVEVDDATFKKNEEMFRFLTEEADKRGIWVIQMFYNIIVSKPFAEKHNLKTQDRKRPIIPVIADYTRKSIAAFVEKYPNVGLLIALGEAMEGDETDVEWFTKTIIPGVKDGLKALGKTDEPPIVLRGHDTNPQLVMKAALPLYKNLYTENKYNGEALTTYTPRGPWAEMHRDLSRLGSTHIDNVHILANLEPFRYGSADFIQKSVQAMHAIHGANGLHLYPEASYWDWPYTADNVTPRQLQIDRDWVWYEAWGRYAWNCHRNRTDEVAYWSARLDGMYGTRKHGQDILEAYEQAGEIAPKLLRRFGITNGNRQTLTLGMFVSQLVNPYKYRVWPDLYTSDGPEGEMLIEWAEKEWKKQPHTGETPPQIVDEVVQHGKLAVEAIDRATPFVRQNKADFDRLRNDIYCYRALADFYAEKVKAATLVLRYHYSQDIQDLEKAVPHLEQSLVHFRKLADLTRDTYLYANSMQTQQRRVPIGGNDGSNKTWVELLPHYQAELATFKKNLAKLKASPATTTNSLASTALPKAAVTLTGETYPLTNNQSPFTDKPNVIQTVSPALQTLSGVRYGMKTQTETPTVVRFSTKQPVQLLVGFFKSTDKTTYLPEPNLETDASANDFGQAEVKIANALVVADMPPVQVHAYTFPAGDHALTLGKGVCLVLGFVDGNYAITPFDAGLASRKGADWLFEE